MNIADVEAKALNCIIFDNSALSKFRSRNINKDYFVMYPEEAVFIFKYCAEYKSSPTSDIIISMFPSFPIEPVDSQSASFVADKLVELTSKRRAEEILEKGIPLLSENPLAAMDYMINNLSAARPHKKLSKDYTDKDALKRFEQLVERKKRTQEKKIIGIRTGITSIDDRLIGWQPGNLVGIVGRLGTGKSWLLMHVSCAAYKDNYKIVYISPEMTIPEVEMRWDTAMAFHYGSEFSNYGIQTGQGIDEEKYKKWLVDISQRSDWITLDSLDGKPFTISAIQSVIEEYRPDLLAVDGVALLSGQRKDDQTWERIMELSYGLKSLASNYGVVIVATQQVNRAGIGKDVLTPRVEQISFGDAFAQACDKVIAMARVKSDDTIRIIEILKGRTGEPEGKRQYITFDVDKGRIGGIIHNFRSARPRDNTKVVAVEYTEDDNN